MYKSCCEVCKAKLYSLIIIGTFRTLMAIALFSHKGTFHHKGILGRNDVSSISEGLLIGRKIISVIFKISLHEI